MKDKITIFAGVITIIGTSIVIGGYIWGADYIKNYITNNINNNIGITKEALVQNTKQLKHQNAIIEERNKSLHKIEEYYVTRMKTLDKEITNAQANISHNNFMMSGMSSDNKEGYKLSAEKSLQYLKLLHDEKKTLMHELSKFIEKNPYTM